MATGAPGEGGPTPARVLRNGEAAPRLVAALLAWAITVAPVGFAHGAPLAASALAIAAVVAGLAGPVLLAFRPRLARHVGISVFVASATAAWLTASTAIHPLRLDPTRAAFGAIAWGVFALSWSDRWTTKPTPSSPGADGAGLQARATLPVLASPIAAAGVAIGLGYIVLAFRVRDPDHALVAQVLALACAIAVVTAAATVAVAREKPRPPGTSKVTPPAVRALVFLVAIAITGALFKALL